ncbi:ROK family protein [Carboxydochorda subterranea]|uniref:ROK family protein n=1 Tax=Carboxydichorda subterranea TaxID=3109565 RepID=A0ABZ1BU71_9FIRM|nr:ROK family protein [Limnochorda sp. L945t]WRP16229.1 ROK family protein [Limnochorda sp. L945t]
MAGVEEPLVVGVDVGGSNVRVAPFQGLRRLGDPVVRATPRDPARVIPVIAGAVRSVVDEQASLGRRVRAVGVGFPGVVDVEQGVSISAGNLPGWTGGPVAAELSTALGLPVALENDVRAGGWGEVWAGAARRASSAVYVSIGTGVGGAVFLGGEAWYGAGFSAGEIGHMVLDASASQARCRCGQVGDAEPLLGGYGVEAMARPFAGRRVMATEVLEAGARGEGGFAEVRSRVVGYFAILLANVAAAFDPEVVVIGGGLGTHPAYPVEEGTARFEKTAPGWLKRTMRVARAELGPHSGITGAAVVALRRLGWERPSRREG